MRVKLGALSVTVMLAGGGLFAAVPSASADGLPSGSVVPPVTTGVETTDAQQVRDFWTPARIRRALANEEADNAALARRVEELTSRATGTASTGSLGLKAEADRVLPAAGGPAILAADAADAADMPVAQPVPFPQSPPFVVAGKILFLDKNGDEHGCSGASIVSDTGNTVWTAGHCVHPGDGTGAEGFYDKITFMPGFKKNDQVPEGYDAPWGKWVATKKVAPEQWTADGDVEDADMAAFDVAVPTGYTSLTAAVGALGYRFGAGSDFPEVIDSGFPGEGYHRTDMDGYTHFYCTGNAEDAFNWNPFDDRVKVDCDMGMGSSGGPIFTTEGQIVSANSHYETEDDGVTRKNDDLFGSEHGDQAVAVINEINR